MTRKRRKAAQPFLLDGPTPEQLAKGGYERKFITHVETATKPMAHVVATEPVERWHKEGRLSDTQYAAIALVRALWRLAGVSQRVTANYGERMPPGTTNEWLAVQEIEAREDLHRIQAWFPRHYWEMFEAVCRFDEPAGTAGSRLGWGTRSARDRAHTVVCFIADYIASKERV